MNIENKFCFDDKTMTFVDLTPSQSLELLEVVREISLKGKVDWTHHMVEAWSKRYAKDGNYKLMLISTVFVSRAYESICSSLLKEEEEKDNMKDKDVPIEKVLSDQETVEQLKLIEHIIKHGLKWEYKGKMGWTIPYKAESPISYYGTNLIQLCDNQDKDNIGNNTKFSVPIEEVLSDKDKKNLIAINFLSIFDGGIVDISKSGDITYGENWVVVFKCGYSLKPYQGEGRTLYDAIRKAVLQSENGTELWDKHINS